MIRSLARPILPTLAVIALLITASSTAQAKAERTVFHGFATAWPTVVRHLRVDEGFAIIEKDSDTGYVIFELAEEGKIFRGALEVVRTKRNDRSALVLIVRIEDRPLYSETGVLDRMVDKLRSEHGDPQPEPAPAPETPRP